MEYLDINNIMEVQEIKELICHRKDLLGCYFTFKTVFFIYRNSSQRSSESVVQAEQIGQEIIIRK